jgi:hypothetical protein
MRQCLKTGILLMKQIGTGDNVTSNRRKAYLWIKPIVTDGMVVQNACSVHLRLLRTVKIGLIGWYKCGGKGSQ